MQRYYEQGNENDVSRKYHNQYTNTVTVHYKQQTYQNI